MYSKEALSRVFGFRYIGFLNYLCSAVSTMALTLRVKYPHGYRSRQFDERNMFLVLAKESPILIVSDTRRLTLASCDQWIIGLRNVGRGILCV